MVCKSVIASMSLGRAWVHGIQEKIKQAAEAGFEGIEIFYEDLEYLAKENAGLSRDSAAEAPTPEENALIGAAQEIREACDRQNLTVMSLQPFMFYGGLLDRKEHAEMVERLKVWFKLLKVLGADIIQVPSNFKPTGISGDLDLIVRDMTELADLGLQEFPPVKFAYENLAWGTYVNTWEVLWDIVCRVDRPNFGVVLDSFNFAGRVWADPTSPDGKTPDADEALKLTLCNLVKTVDMQKVWYLQIADAERMNPPLVEGHPFYDKSQPARMSWSRNARCFIYEKDRGGYLPVEEIVRVFLVELGFEGWVSMELFSRTTTDPDPSVPRCHARRGFAAWKRLEEDLALRDI